MTEIKKILIIRLSSIGDIILTTPLIRAVRKKYPYAQLFFLVKKNFESILKYNPHINHLIIFDKNKGRNELKRIALELKNQNIDWIIDIHRNFRSFYLRKILKPSLITSYSKKIIYRTLLVYFKINRYKNNKQIYLRYFEAVEKQGIQYDGKGTEVYFSDDDHNEIKNTLAADGYTNHQLLIVICPGASSENKRWLKEYFATVGEHFVKMENAFIALLGGPQDEKLCNDVKKIMTVGAMNYAGVFLLSESAALLKKADLVITNDTGMMHAAQSQKTPVVAIFGPTTKELGYFPLPDHRSIVIENNGLRCRPCTHNGLNKCPRQHFKCMKEILPHQVIKAAEKLLSI